MAVKLFCLFLITCVLGSQLSSAYLDNPGPYPFPNEPYPFPGPYDPYPYPPNEPYPFPRPYDPYPYPPMAKKEIKKEAESEESQGKDLPSENCVFMERVYQMLCADADQMSEMCGAVINTLTSLPQCTKPCEAGDQTARCQLCQNCSLPDKVTDGLCAPGKVCCASV